MLFSSCKKDESTDPDSGLPTYESIYGNVRFTCTSDNPYLLYIDGSFKTTVNGQSFVEYDLVSGEHVVKAEQKSGYVLYPTVRQTTLNVKAGKSIEWMFP